MLGAHWQNADNAGGGTIFSARNRCGGWRNSTAGKELAVHVVDLDLIPRTLYSSLSTVSD